MKKICKNCGRNRKIGKFGKSSKYSDGKNIYCRDCMRDWRNEYKHTKGRIIYKDAKKKWRDNNKNKISGYNKEYYQKNRKRILLYNLSKRKTESILIFENPKNKDKLKINKSRSVYPVIEINPKRK